MQKTKKILSLLATFVMAMMIFVGCSSKPTTMQDREGNEFNLPAEINTIISTAPSNTEVLVGLGLADKLVAVDKYSADVEGVSKDLPKIDFRNPDAEAIIALNPDIVIASGHNKAGDEDPFALIKEAGIPVAYIPSSYSIEGIYGDIEFIASLTDTEKEGKELVNSMKKEVDAIKAIGDTIQDKKNVYFEIGAGSGLYTFGNETFLNEMIETIGATNIFGEENSWITVTPEAVIDANPDVILANTPGTNEAGLTAVEDIVSREGWDTITAVKNGDVYQIDKNSSSRGSQNIIKALKEMAKAVYPDEYKGL
ncbi:MULTISPECIES: ABC transporter substrate-binding protein [unclassified Clostridium]|uniref:ABC transporter substrate-binding protein n=1 Tax=Clostridium TaxID=1485 RepID=UPI001C8B75C5|nr:MULTISPECIES: ABC transporter substrate-binding protein [unclassified Clostridium]MBX9137716.1 ABC transporter substrate-binding protein [Clostridium sp. K12(2020)]MBX9144659.1 ABC transporter substrate-binding protein [Clostridium sp. K13]MDU2290453.1 ABC transporter substrate-binding protein [Clostridium celatum]MDU4325093.1 ABC transporter substrate-binding protein [Clostridium celatum]